MSDAFAQVTVQILEKEYQIACPADEKTNLLASVELLNKKMGEIRDRGNVVGLDRIAIIAAINLANDLLKRTRDEQLLKDIVGSRIGAMSERLDGVLGPNQQLNS